MFSPPTNTSRKLAWGIYLFFLFIYILTSTGGIASSDGLTMFYVTQSLVERGEVSVPGGNTTPGRDGKLYARSGLGLSLVAIPFYFAGKAGAALAPVNFKALALKGMVSLTNAFVSAGACLIFFLLCGYFQWHGASHQSRVHLEHRFVELVFREGLARKITAPMVA